MAARKRKCTKCGGGTFSDAKLPVCANCRSTKTSTKAAPLHVTSAQIKNIKESVKKIQIQLQKTDVSDEFDHRYLNLDQATFTAIETLMATTNAAKEALVTRLRALVVGERALAVEINRLKSEHSSESIGTRAIAALGNLVAGRQQFTEQIRDLESQHEKFSNSVQSCTIAIQGVEKLAQNIDSFLSTPGARKWSDNPGLTIRRLEKLRVERRNGRGGSSEALGKRPAASRKTGNAQADSMIDGVEMFRGMLQESCGPVSREIMERAANNTSNVSRLYATEGREFLIRSFEAAIKSDLRECARNFQLSLEALANGVSDPCPSEWPLDGAEFGAAHALMWFGIAKSISGMSPSDVFMPLRGELQSPDGCFASASYIFWELGQPLDLARTLQEWAEHRRDWSDKSGAQSLYRVSSLFFQVADNPLRADIVDQRSKFRGEELGSIQFFDRRNPQVRGVHDHSTVLGSKQSKQLELALIEYQGKKK